MNEDEWKSEKKKNLISLSKTFICEHFCMAIGTQDQIILNFRRDSRYNLSVLTADSFDISSARVPSKDDSSFLV